MPVDPSIVATWTQEIHVATPTGVDSHGEKSFGSPVSRLARVEVVEKVIQNANGEFVRTTHWISTGTAIGEFDRIWLPGSDETKAGEARLPQEIKSAPWEDGSVHWEVRV